MNSAQFIRKCRHFQRNLCLLVLSAAFIPALSQPTFTQQVPQLNSTLLQQEIEVTKSSTTFDGTNKDGSITYISLNGENGIEASIAPASDLFEELDYTFMIWMKPEKNVWASHLSYAFVIPKAFGCYFSGSKTLVCESSQVCDKLNITTAKVVPNEWVHLTVSGSKTKRLSYSSLETRTEEVGSDLKDYVILQQPTFWWEVCIGICAEKFGFKGGVRDFIFIEEYITKEQAFKIKNHYLTWDKNILAYYRFGTDYLNDEFTSTRARTLGKKPSVETELVSNDICYPFSNFEQFQLFDEDQILQNMTLNEKFEPKKLDYSYTFSLWVYFFEDNCYETQPHIAATSCFIFQLYDSFMLYMERPNYARFYFFAFKNYFEISSTAFFVPYNSWVNIQLSFNQYKGYTIGTYDMQGREMERLSKIYNMQEQFPRKKTISLLPFFRGYARSFFLFGAYRTLPFDISINDYISNPDFIYYLKFQPQYNGEQNSYLDNHGDISGVTQIALYKEDPKYEYLEFYHQVDQGKTDAGTSQATQALFDGVACNDGSLTLMTNSTTSYVRGETADLEGLYTSVEELPDTLPINSTNSSNSSDSNETDSSPEPVVPVVREVPSMIENATVEFWFKPSQIDTIDYLFTLYSNKFENEFFSIFQDADKNLICAPFGFISFSSPVVIYSNVTTNNMNNWFHLTCSYQFQQDIEGMLYFDETEFIYSQDILTMPQYLPLESFDVFIGNSQTTTDGSLQVFYKDVRIWGARRTQEQIRAWRFRQVSPFFWSSTELLAYFRLNSGNFEESNYKYISDEEFQVKEALINEIQYLPDVNLTICPQYTYFYEGLCYDKPLDFLLTSVFPVHSRDNDQEFWNFTVRHSAMLDYKFFTEIKFTWASEDPLLQSFISEQQGSLDLMVPAAALADNRNYMISSYATNNQTTFIEQSNVNFLPISCKWVEAEDGGLYDGYKVINEPKSTADVQIILKVKTVRGGCDSYYDKLVPNITYFMSPKLRFYPQLVIEQTDSETIVVTVPKAQQFKFDSQVDIKLNFQVYWTNSAYEEYINNYDSLFQSVLYSIHFAYSYMQVIPSLTTNYDSVLQFDTVVLDASASYIDPLEGDEKYENLTFSWICPLSLSVLCLGKFNSQLPILYNQFVLAEGRFDYEYTFQVEIIWTTPTNKEIPFYSQISVSWYDIPSLNFEVLYIEPILSTNANTLRIGLDNYLTQDITGNLEITWAFIPQISEEDLEQRDPATVTVKPNAFNTNTQYQMIVEVQSILYPSATLTHDYTFLTKYPPYGGTAEISPTVGFFDDTPFTIFITNWQSDFPPVQYQVWQADGPDSEVPSIQITDDWVNAEFSYTFKATSSDPFIVIITDASQEVVMQVVSASISANPTLTSNSGQNGESNSELISKIEESESNLSKKYDYMQLLATSSESESSVYLLDTIEKDIDLYKNRKSKSKFVAAEGSSILSKVLASDNSIEDEQISQTSFILTEMEGSKGFDEEIQENSAFLNSYSTSLSSILTLNNEKNREELSSSGRHLKETTVEDRVDIQKKTQEQVVALGNQLCSTLGQTYFDQYVDTEAFTLIVHRVDATFQKDILEVTHLDESKTFIQIDVVGILNEAFSIRQVDSSVLCSQVIYFKEDPFATFALQQNLTEASHSLWLDVVDASQNSIQPYIDLQLFANVSFQLAPQTYSDNQTVCMKYDVEKQLWDDQGCMTTINYEAPNAECYCKSSYGAQYALLTDSTRVKGTEEILDTRKSTVSSSSSFANEVITEPEQPAPTVSLQASIEAKLVYVCFVAFLVGFAIFVPVLAYIFDKRDLNNYNKKIDNTIKWQLLMKVAEVSQEPVSYWKYKQDEVLSYNIKSLSTFSHLLYQLHPLLGILNKFDLLESRIVRFSVFNLQMALYSLICVITFGSAYRNNEERNEMIIDQYDINMILGLGMLGMIMLLPWPISFSCLKNRYMQKLRGKLNSERSPEDQTNYQLRIQEAESAANDILVEVKCQFLKYALLVSGYLINAIVVILTILYAKDVNFNQYCLVSAFFIGFFGSMFVSNIIKIWVQSLLLNQYAKSKSGWLEAILSKQVIRIQQEMEFARKADKELCKYHLQPEPIKGITSSNDQISQKRLNYEEHQICDFEQIVLDNQIQEEGNARLEYQSVQDKQMSEHSDKSVCHSAQKNLQTFEEDKEKEGGEQEINTSILGEDRRGKMSVFEKVRSSIEKSQRIKYQNMNEDQLREVSLEKQ